MNTEQQAKPKISIKMTIENINNKLASDCFLQLWINLGGLHNHNEQGHDLINSHVFKINDMPCIWRIHDIGSTPMAEMPNWMCIMSHNIGKKEFKEKMNLQADSIVYFVIFKKQTP